MVKILFIFILIHQVASHTKAQCPSLISGLSSTNNYISRVDFAGIKNNSTSSTGGFTDYSASITGIIQAGSAIPIKINVAPGVSNASVTTDKYKVTIYIDWDKNGNFTGTNETTNLRWYNNPSVNNFNLVDGATGFSAKCPYTGYTSCTMDMWGLIKVPLSTTVTPGSYKMYVSLIRSNAATPTTFPCGNSTGIGELEIYNLTVPAAPSYPRPVFTNNAELAVFVGSIRLVFVGLNDIYSTIDNTKGYINDYNYFNMYNSDSTVLVRGIDYNFTIGMTDASPSTLNTNTTYKVWIDLNKNGTLENPAELVITTTTGTYALNTNSDVIVIPNNSFIVPTGTATGATLMRVALAPFDRNNPLDPYKTNDFCQYHDYKIILRQGCTGSNMVNQGNFNYPLSNFSAAPPNNVANTFTTTGYTYFNWKKPGNQWEYWNGATYISGDANSNFSGDSKLTVYQQSDWGWPYYNIHASKNTLSDWWGTNYFGGHGGGPYLLVNGGNVANSKPWCQRVSFPSTGLYMQSFYVANVGGPSLSFTSNNNPPNIEILVDNMKQCLGESIIPISPDVSSQSNGKGWTNIRFLLNITVPGVKEVCINAISFGSGGNDYAIDDISLRKCGVSEKESNTFCATPLALHSIDFKVKLSPNNTSYLNWNAENDANIENYAIQRSNNSLVWSDIDSLYSVKISKKYIYFYEDKMPLPGINHYRIRLKDIFQNFKYSQIETVQIKYVKVAIKIYPTELNQSQNLNIEFGKSDILGNDAQVEIINTMGIIVQKINISNIQTNKNQQVQLADLPIGMYIVKINIGSEGQTFKIAIIED